MTDNLVKRLRHGVGAAVGSWPEAIHEAADRIEELEAELATAEEIGRAFEEDAGQLREKLAKAMQVLDETRIVLAEYEPHPLPVLAKVLATIAELKGQGDD